MNANMSKQQGCPRLLAPSTQKPVASSFVSHPPQVYTRRKRFVSKVKSGCLTCRERRIKCGECKPTCKQCITAGRSCRYADSSISLQSAVVPKVAPSEVLAESEDDALYYFYRTEARGHIKMAFFSSGWIEELLPANHTYPAVWHATLAMAAAFRTFLAHPQSRQYPKQHKITLLAYKHYGKALEHLRVLCNSVDLTPLDKGIILGLPIFFSYLNNIIGDPGTSIANFQMGLDLYKLWRPQNERHETRTKHMTKSYLDSISTTYLRVQKAFSMSSKLHSPFKNPNTGHTEPVLQTIQDMYTRVESIYNEVLGRFPSFDDVERARLIGALRHLERVLDELDLTKPSSEVGVDLNPIRMRSISTRILAEVSLAQSELGFDSFIPEFRTIVDLAKVTLDRPASPNLLFRGQIIDSVFFVATRCRNFEIRLAALRLPLLGLTAGSRCGLATSWVRLEHEHRECEEAKCAEGRVPCRSHRLVEIVAIKRKDGSHALGMRTEDERAENRQGTVIEWIQRDDAKTFVICPPAIPLTLR